MKSQCADDNTCVVESNCNPNPREAKTSGSLRLSSQSHQIREQQGQGERSRDEDTRHWPQASSGAVTCGNAHRSESFLSVDQCLPLRPYASLRLKLGGCCLRINLSLVKKGSSKFKVCWKALLQYVKLLEYFKETDFLVPLGPLHCLIKLHCFIVDTQWSRGVQIIAGVCN